MLDFRGAFLIPYLLSLLVCGLPLYFLEAAVGQFSGRSSVKVWAVCPLLIGAGIGMNVYSVILFWYYNTIMAWALYYIVASFQAVVPWSRCDGWWNTPSCTVLDHASNGSSLEETDTSVRANVTNETAPEVLKWKRVSPQKSFGKFVVYELKQKQAYGTMMLGLP
nr:hypothetical protein BaRGS_001950 [Batillaria attramentaria]